MINALKADAKSRSQK